MLLLLFRELLEDGSAALVFRDGGGARVELQAAAFGRDRHAQRIAREHAIGRHPFDRRRFLAGPALLARADDLDHGLRRREIAGRCDLLHQAFDIGAEKLGRAMAGGADQMKVTGMPVGRLEARAAVAEIDLARDAGADHPQERAVDGGAPDAGRLGVHAGDEIVRAQVSFLAEEHLDDAIAFRGALTAGRNRRDHQGR